MCVPGTLEDGNVVVDFCAVFLGDTLCDPHDVAALLLLELQIRVEHTKVELLHEGHHIQTHLLGKTNISKCLFLHSQ
jgi:hypothetical protein